MKEMLQVQEIDSDLFGKQIQMHMVRLDLFEPDIPGNKYWKMKYNIQAMQEAGQNHLVTFGGAYSNHIAAVAAAGKKYGFKTTGIIRGEAESISNATLSLAQKNGMIFHFIDRSTYRSWKQGAINLDDFLGITAYYLLPEGGSNVLAVKGCHEILQSIENTYDLVTCPVGTGATLAGIIAGASEDQKVLGISSMKGGQYIEEDIKNLLHAFDPNMPKKHWSVNHDFHFGGFAKIKPELLDFFHHFKNEIGIELDLIYTAKMMYGLKELIQEGKIAEHSRVLAVHTGGQQGNEGFMM